MSIRVRQKNQLYMVTETPITYHIKRNKQGKISSNCACKIPLCKHIIAVISHKNQSYSVNINNYLQIPQIRSYIIDNFNAVLTVDLFKMINTYLEEHDCMICYYPLINDCNHWQCPKCNIVFHKKCRIKWKRNTCPSCCQ